MNPKVNRKPTKFLRDQTRVIMRPHRPGGNDRLRNIVDRIICMKDEQVARVLRDVISEFSGRHRQMIRVLEEHYQQVAGLVPGEYEISHEQKLLIGAFFTLEYSIESAALFNPSIVANPDQSGLGPDELRFIMSFRATGEGHISSIEFRTGKIDADNNIALDPVTPYVETAAIRYDTVYEKHLFQLKLNEMETCNEVTTYLLEKLPEAFTFAELERAIDEMRRHLVFFRRRQEETFDVVRWLARSNYEISFRPERELSECVIFPVSENESRGIEDARFVRFVDDDGEATYYATYTAYNGFNILPQLIATREFRTFKVITLNGLAAQNKGMALFPRRINGQYAMLSRQDGENNHIMFSDNIHFWQESRVFQEPEYPWEFIQIGNCGSPMETTDGWLVLTHGVGAMRKYSIGAMLLDLEDPSRVIGRLRDPILSPRDEEREGYVPNVVYTCGGMIHNGEVIIPYAMSDTCSGIATVSVADLMATLQSTPGRGAVPEDDPSLCSDR
ncbi:MAG: glycoside hydrolase family 130 protein [Candidatus Eisenbacteria sp.]|nr:glycoside hydrolase family 130 protein [Candidatus Eisenbacteria bacterium]